MDVFPDFEGLGGIGDLREVIGALLTFVLIIAVLMLIICAIVWALSTANGHHAAATKARVGAWTALGAALLAVPGHQVGDSRLTGGWPLSALWRRSVL